MSPTSTAPMAFLQCRYQRQQAAHGQRVAAIAGQAEDAGAADVVPVRAAAATLRWRQQRRRRQSSSAVSNAEQTDGVTRMRGPFPLPVALEG